MDEMTTQEWESLCDGCGRCCMVKLEDEDSSVHLTRLSCALLDVGSCQCSDYANRHEKMPDCVKIDAKKVRDLFWLPQTCAYRLVAEGKPLPDWHPLISGSAETVHEAGISVRGWARSEQGIDEEDIERYIVPDFPILQ